MALINVSAYSKTRLGYKNYSDVKVNTIADAIETEKKLRNELQHVDNLRTTVKVTLHETERADDLQKFVATMNKVAYASKDLKTGVILPNVFLIGNPKTVVPVGY